MAGSRLVIPSQQPVQSTGLPYAGGQLFFYLSGTSTLTPTYQDSGLTTPNTNPVDLDSAGNAGNVFLDPAVTYKIVLEDANGDQVWTYDPVYPFASTSIVGLIEAGTSSGSGNAQTLSGISPPTNGQALIWTAGFTNTGPMTLATTTAYNQYKAGATGPEVLVGGEVTAGSTYLSIFLSALNSDAGGWQLIGQTVTAANIEGLGTGVAAALAEPINSTGGLLTFQVPVITIYASGSGTYTTPTGANYLSVELVGGGSGGQGSQNSSPGPNSSAAAASTFGTFSAGGANGSSNITAAIASNGTLNVSGAIGESYTANAAGQSGAPGASSFFGGGGGSAYQGAGLAAVAPGAGGGGGGSTSGANGVRGGGGNAGAYCWGLISSPAATYAYAVGTGSAGGAAGTSGAAGGAGAAGLIKIIAYFQ